MNLQAQHPLAEIYLDLVCNSYLWTDRLDSALRTVMAATGKALSSQRVGLWSFSTDRKTLTLMLGFDALRGGFKHGAELVCENFPNYFSRMASVLVDAVADVQHDPIFSEFIEREAISPDIKAILNTTIHVASKRWGILVVSDFNRVRTWSEWECWFLSSVAGLVAQLLTNAEAQRNEGWLRFIADNLPLSVIKFDLDARCDYANPHWLQLTQASAEAAYGRGWLQFVHPDDRDAMLERILMVGVSGERDSAELRLLIGKQTIWAACSWVAERNVEGMPVAILSTFANVTHQRTLRENERRYRALFDNSGDAIFLMQGERFVDCNERTLEMFACAREDIIGQPPYRFSPVTQPDGRPSQEKAIEKITAALNGERQFFEWRHSRRDGSVFMAEVTLTCVNLNDEPHLLAAVRDISERKIAEDAIKQSNERLRRINSIAATLYGLRDVESVARASVEILSEYESAPLVRFFVYESAAQIITLLAQRDGHNSVVAFSDRSRQRKIVEGTQDIDVITNVDVQDMSALGSEEVRKRGTRSITYVWLRGETERIGLIVLEYRELMTIDDSQRDNLIAIGKAVSMALSNVLFISRIEYQATHDVLTGLPNRLLLQRELESLATTRERESGFMLLDLDRFKEVNDTLGHHVGDQLLITLAQRLSSVLQHENALLCRLGGDEFAILLRDTSATKLQRTAELLLEALRRPVAVDDLILEVAGSIGISLFPQQSASGVELLRLADVAMYQAKRTGSGLAFYDRQFDLYSPERLALLQELRGAISSKQLVLHYQPRLSLCGEGVLGFEALVRWQHPQRGLLAPDLFVPLAEMNDVIHALTVEVLDQALFQQRAWLQRGLRYSISVNLSARNLINEECFFRLKQLLIKYESDPTLLELEITETALMHDPSGAAKLLASLAPLGIKFSIDDFGTGYSSLAYLRQLPINALKIDRTFVGDMARSEHDATIVQSTIAMAHNLKLDVIAEGVEDAAALQMLREMGCDEAQGYFISKPQSAEVIEQWLQQSAWSRDFNEKFFR